MWVEEGVIARVGGRGGRGGGIAPAGESRWTTVSVVG